MVQVYGVDVGYGQVAEKVRTDERVTVLERTNLRTLSPEALGSAKIDLITLDLSFISVLKVLPALCAVAAPEAVAVVLIKPQFEAGVDGVSRGGVVRKAEVHESVVASVTEGFAACGWRRLGVTESPVRGAKGGNVEFLAHFARVEETYAEHIPLASEEP
jgi:23S rRNA (cytidine1920-2'-O)/16S rRNA (cytidine1409-2'-O)-methyltransferase